jgi:hypothetical protein
VNVDFDLLTNRKNYDIISSGGENWGEVVENPTLRRLLSGSENGNWLAFVQEIS